MQSKFRPLVLVHGLWDNPRVFKRLIREINQPDLPISAPFLPHKLGKISLFDLANDLDKRICDRWGDDTEIDLLGFSMGGVVGRIWLQKLGGVRRTFRFISIGSPHYGSWMAHVLPHFYFKGVADMGINSCLLRELNNELPMLSSIECISYYCLYDLMVIPGSNAILRIGESYSLPALTHKGLIKKNSSLRIICESILK